REILRAAGLAVGRLARLLKNRRASSLSTRCAVTLSAGSRVSRMVVWGPSGVTGTGALLAQLIKHSVSVERSSLTRRSLMSGGVWGKTNTDTAAEAGERAPTSPSWRSSADQATARYHRRRQPGVTVVSAKVTSGPAAFRTVMGGPMVSALVASLSLAIRYTSICLTAGPVRRLTLRLTTAWATVSGSAIAGAEGTARRGVAAAMNCLLLEGQADSC